MVIGSLTVPVSEEERNDIIENMLGKRFDGNIDYGDFDECGLINASKREAAKEEILSYMIQKIKEEYLLADDGEALLKWDEYKTKHNLLPGENYGNE